MNLRRLPEVVRANGTVGGETVVRVKTDAGRLNPVAIPHVPIIKAGSFHERGDASVDAHDVADQLAKAMSVSALCGVVAEGLVPYGVVNPSVDSVLREAAHRGVPVVMVARGSPGGPVVRRESFLSGGNLTATKARLLLMASLLRFGGLPAATNPLHPTATEKRRLERGLARYQAIFDTH